MNKRRLSLAALTASMFFLSLVSAFSAYDARYQVERGLDSFRQILAPFFEILFGVYESSEFFWTKVLLFVLVFVMVKFALEKVKQFEKNKQVVFIVSIVVSIFAIRYISETELIRGILLPYNVLGIAILTILPFLIFFWFVNVVNFGPTGRKMAWAFYGIVFAVLWFNRFDDLSPLGNQIYGWTLVVMIIIFIFDSKIHEYFGLMEARRLEREHIKTRIVHLEAKLDELYRIAEPSDATKQKIKDWEDRKRELYGQL